MPPNGETVSWKGRGGVRGTRRGWLADAPEEEDQAGAGFADEEEEGTKMSNDKKVQASADLDDQLNSIIETSWVIEWTLDDTRELLEKLEGKKFTVQLDDQSIETVKGIHSKFFANEKKLIEEAQQRMEKMLSQHREKLTRIKDGESVWLSFKAWVWAIIIFEISLLLVGTVIYYIAKAKFT